MYLFCVLASLPVHTCAYVLLERCVSKVTTDVSERTFTLLNVIVYNDSAKLIIL